MTTNRLLQYFFEFNLRFICLVIILLGGYNSGLAGVFACGATFLFKGFFGILRLLGKRRHTRLVRGGTPVTGFILFFLLRLLRELSLGLGLGQDFESLLLLFFCRLCFPFTGKLVSEVL